MNALETIGQRRSARKLASLPLFRKVLLRVVAAATEAPHGGNAQGRHFLKKLDREGRLHWERFGDVSPA